MLVTCQVPTTNYSTGITLLTLTNFLDLGFGLNYFYFSHPNSSPNPTHLPKYESLIQGAQPVNRSLLVHHALFLCRMRGLLENLKKLIYCDLYLIVHLPHSDAKNFLWGYVAQYLAMWCFRGGLVRLLATCRDDGI